MVSSLHQSALMGSNAQKTWSVRHFRSRRRWPMATIPRPEATGADRTRKSHSLARDRLKSSEERSKVSASPVGNADTETLAKVAALAGVFCFEGFCLSSSGLCAPFPLPKHRLPSCSLQRESSKTSESWRHRSPKRNCLGGEAPEQSTTAGDHVAGFAPKLRSTGTEVLEQVPPCPARDRRTSVDEQSPAQSSHLFQMRVREATATSYRVDACGHDVDHPNPCQARLLRGFRFCH